MTIRIYTITILLLLSSLRSFAQTEWTEVLDGEGGNKPISIYEISPGLPKIKDFSMFVNHGTSFSLEYDEQHEQAKWVAYELTKEETDNVYKRTNKFMADPKVSTGSATDKDYARSGYDRGHLAPAADMGWSKTSIAESFYYSNMSTQLPKFNRGIWKRLEEQVRQWAIQNEAVYVVSGPVLTPGLPTIGPNKVSVPQYFYKVVLVIREPSVKGIGFLMLNAGSSDPLQRFAVPIDSVESVTGIDFFPVLDDKEEKTEGSLCIECWEWR